MSQYSYKPTAIKSPPLLPYCIPWGLREDDPKINRETRVRTRNHHKAEQLKCISRTTESAKHTCRFSRLKISPTAKFCFITWVIFSFWFSKYSFTAFGLEREANCCSFNFILAWVEKCKNKNLEESHACITQRHLKAKLTNVKFLRPPVKQDKTFHEICLPHNKEKSCHIDMSTDLYL